MMGMFLLSQLYLHIIMAHYISTITHYPSVHNLLTNAKNDGTTLECKLPQDEN